MTHPDRALRIGITLGDPAGIGPEVAAAVLSHGLPEGIEVHVYGDVAALRRAGSIPHGTRLVRFATASVEPGQPDPASAKGIVDSIRSAALDCLGGKLDAMVTGPISKSVLGRAGYTYPGHTELLESVCGGRGRAVMMLAGGSLRVVPATIHCALREVPGRLEHACLDALLEIVDSDLRERFGLPAPRIAVCGLNPHAGENGRFGDEEPRLIAPAIAAARERGVDARGPLSADTLFARAVAGEFDVVVGMYHDQVLGPLKLHAFGRAVNVTLGLPLIRTSVDHGTAFDIAGRGESDPGSMHEALALAIALARNRRQGIAPTMPKTPAAAAQKAETSV